MAVIAVVNRKGGSGKSTLATHLAAWYATRGLPVVLGDVDRQQSTQWWLRQRNASKLAARGRIVGWNADPRTMVRPPTGYGHVILDTPGGLRGFELARVVMYADAVLMPVCNAAFDRASAAECAAELRTMPRVTAGRCRIGAIGMRVDASGRGAAALQGWAAQEQLELIGSLRYVHTYVRCTEQGLTLFDLPPDKVATDLDQWRPIFAWLDAAGSGGHPAAEMPAAAPETPAAERRSPVAAPVAARAAARSATAVREPTRPSPVRARVAALPESPPTIPASIAATIACELPESIARLADAAPAPRPAARPAPVRPVATAAPRQAAGAPATSAVAHPAPAAPAKIAARADAASARSAPRAGAAAVRAQPAGLQSGIGRLLGALQLPRFLQRNS